MKLAANRSVVVRRAVREFAARHRKHEREERDRRILGAHRDQIELQAASLVAEQAEPALMIGVEGHNLEEVRKALEIPARARRRQQP